MDWRKTYQERLCTAEEAVKIIESGDRVVLGHCAAEPMELIDAMVANYKNYKDVKVSTMVTLGKGEYSQKKYEGHFKFEGWFVQAATRNSINEGHGDFVPVFFHEVPINIRKGIFPVDISMVSFSPPDEHGYCSAGVSSDYTMEAIKASKYLIAEVNDQMPYVYGDTFVHISRMKAIVETSYPIPELEPPVIGEVEKAIGKNCAALIDDGCTLQLGIGAIPDAVLSQLGDKKDLGIHSEMISDGVVDLFEKGVITGQKKSMDQRKIVATFLLGTRKLYDFAHKNPAVEMRTVDYVNYPLTVAECSKMISINSCIQVDFMGQVAAESIGARQFSGVGGQVDFVRGTAMAKDGKAKSIIAMASFTKTKDGKMISKIVPYLDYGAPVTTSRCDIDYIVTEYGIARLKGALLQDRARALIGIAHPDFREELKKAFEERFNVPF